MIGTLSCVPSIYQLVRGRSVGKVALHFSVGLIGVRVVYRLSSNEAVMLGKGTALTVAVAGVFLIGAAHGTMPQTPGEPGGSAFCC